MNTARTASATAACWPGGSSKRVSRASKSTWAAGTCIRASSPRLRMSASPRSTRPWARCWSVVVGGGGIKGGIAYGSTDSDGTSVKDNPVSVGDLFATVYKGMGLDPALQIRDNLGRPMKIAEGNPIKELV